MRGRAGLRAPLRAPLRARLRSPPLLSLLPFLTLLTLLTLLPGPAPAAAAEASPQLPAPENVEIYSYNFQSVLRWSPVVVENGSVLYTAHYKTGFFQEWSGMGCAGSPQPQCRFPPELRRRWTVVLRVRAELGALASPWVLTPPFVAEMNTTLGPPRVNSVSSSPDSLLLSISPPFTPEPGDLVQYHVSYWENTTSAIKQKLNGSKTLFQIGNLKESTLYCFSVQVQLKIYSGHLLQGQQSVPECHRTALSEATQAVHIILLFVLALLFVPPVTYALLLLWKYHQKIKYWSQPPLQIPSHFREFLRDPGLSGLELYSPAEEEPQALVVGEGNGLEDEDPSPNTSRDRGDMRGHPSEWHLPQDWPQAAPMAAGRTALNREPGITG